MPVTDLFETYYLPHPLYQLAETWQVWLDEYRDIVRDVQEIYEGPQQP